jgi:hypothetical protein
MYARPRSSSSEISIFFIGFVLLFAFRTLNKALAAFSSFMTCPDETILSARSSPNFPEYQLIYHLESLLINEIEIAISSNLATDRPENDSVGKLIIQTYV